MKKTKKPEAGKDYLLRAIPEELHKALKHKAVDDGVSVREIILRALWTLAGK